MLTVFSILVLDLTLVLYGRSFAPTNRFENCYIMFFKPKSGEETRT